MAKRWDGKRMSYQTLLRVIGAHLDEHGCCRSSVTEDGDGFTVTYWAQQTEQNPTRVRFTFEQLWQGDERSTRQRTSGESDASPGYQDLFRAVGYELDQLPACTVHLDEARDTLLVSYRYDVPGATRLSQERDAVLGKSERRDLLRQAIGRRSALVAAIA